MKRIQINPLQAKLISIVLSLCLLAVMEISARMLYHEDRELHKILDLLEPDHNLFWKMRPRLNVSFHGVRILTNKLGFREKEIPLVKKSGTLRILCLGASPTFGWGVSETDRYSNVLHKMLRESAFTGENLEVINAGVIGYSSYQGAVLLKKIMPVLKPDIVTVPFVVNDVDKYRFFLNDGKSDGETVSPSGVRLFIEASLARSGLVKVLRRVVFGWNTDSAELRIKSRLPFTDARRVSADNYHDNLLAIVQAAGQQGAKVILMKMPVYNPFPDHTAGSDSDRLEAEELFAAGLRQAESGDRVAACNTITKALAYAPYSAKM
ncbi:MAG: GDSL-type esterase/lipase family protein, partial [bacterium]